MSTGKKLLLMGALSVLAIVTYAKSPSRSTISSPTTPSTSDSTTTTSDISGNYQCRGYDPFGKSNYSNPVTISKHGDTYSVEWINAKGYPFLLGTGIFNQDVNDVISVVFWDPKKTDYFGTEVFKIKPDRSLSANWTLQGENQVGTESCTKNE